MVEAVHRRQVLVISSIQRPIDASITQILKIVQKVSRSSLIWGVLDQIFVAYLSLNGVCNRGSGPPNEGSSVLYLYH
jgi:hypothetical protein